MSYLPYKLIHLTGIFAFLLLAGIAGARRILVDTPPLRGWIPPLQALSAAMILVGGFGMLARLGYLTVGVPPWATVKLGIWGLLVAGLFLVRRGPVVARAVLVATPLLAVLAATIALYKPK